MKIHYQFKLHFQIEINPNNRIGIDSRQKGIGKFDCSSKMAKGYELRLGWLYFHRSWQDEETRKFWEEFDND